ncbi:MAG: molybdate ABC transporter substrate-binding protein [Campylobacterota bacterium]|nr:molybdate ABC transporter substrate-binding protein [Campylobacterota bacterium]
MLKKFIVLNVFLSSFIYAGTINIAVAANVSYAIDTLKQQFNKQHPKTKVRVILGSSGKLTAKIKNGAPYDLLMSANMFYPETLYKEGIAVTKPIVYAQGALAILSNNQRSFRHGIKLLKSKLVKRVAIANPKTAPYGKATFEALENAGILGDVKQKIIYGESISQTVSYTMMAADVGIIAKSSLYSKKMKKFKQNLHWKEVDKNLYTPIDQGMVILKRAKVNAEVKAFYEFMKSKKAKKILEEFGYQIP